MSALTLSPEPVAVPPSGNDTDIRWTRDLTAFLQPDWDNVVAGEFATGVIDGRWSVAGMRGWIVQLYPFIHIFPKFLAEALIKAEDEYARNFLIDNIRIERAHAEHWIWMGEGFGIPRQEMLAMASGECPTLRDVQSLTDWIWFINAKGSFAEAVAATSFAIEGATGALSRALLAGFEAYGSRPGVRMNLRTTKWARNHARYDDDHPRVALEVAARAAQTEATRRKVMLAARRSLQLLNQALLCACHAYCTEAAPIFARQPVQRRGGDRRRFQVPIGFPDRRVAQRRKSADTPAPRPPAI